MAIGFDEGDDYYSIADAAELTLQNGDWVVGVWTYVSDNAGSSYQYLVSSGNLVNGSINIHLAEDSEAGGRAGEWTLYVVDDDGTIAYIHSTSTPGGDSTWRLIVAQHCSADNEVQLWFCTAGGSAVKAASTADTDFGQCNGGDWNVGRRTDGDADRYYGSVACELFKGNFSLSQAQIEALADGLPVKTLAKGAGLTLDLYLPMWEADAVLVDYSGSGNNATRSSVPTTATHAPVCTPVKRRRMG